MMWQCIVGKGKSGALKKVVKMVVLKTGAKAAPFAGTIVGGIYDLLVSTDAFTSACQEMFEYGSKRRISRLDTCTFIRATATGTGGAQPASQPQPSSVVEFVGQQPLRQAGMDGLASVLGGHNLDGQMGPVNPNLLEGRKMLCHVARELVRLANAKTPDGDEFDGNGAIVLEDPGGDSSALCGSSTRWGQRQRKWLRLAPVAPPGSHHTYRR
jgi:hypothetical protein